MYINVGHVQRVGDNDYIIINIIYHLFGYSYLLRIPKAKQ